MDAQPWIPVGRAFCSSVVSRSRDDDRIAAVAAELRCFNNSNHFERGSQLTNGRNGLILGCWPQRIKLLSTNPSCGENIRRKNIEPLRPQISAVLFL